MNGMQVLASWGLPNLRQSYLDRNAETWTYYAVDPYSHRVIGYQLLLVDQHVSSWVIDRNVSDLGTLTPEELIGMQSGSGGTSIPQSTPTSSSVGGPIKK